MCFPHRGGFGDKYVVFPTAQSPNYAYVQDSAANSLSQRQDHLGLNQWSGEFFYRGTETIEHARNDSSPLHIDHTSVLDSSHFNQAYLHTSNSPVHGNSIQASDDPDTSSLSSCICESGDESEGALELNDVDKKPCQWSANNTTEPAPSVPIAQQSPAARAPHSSDIRGKQPCSTLGSLTAPKAVPSRFPGKNLRTSTRFRNNPPTSTGTHSGSRKKSKMHKCETCSKSFPRPSGLTTHQNSHSGNKRKLTNSWVCLRGRLNIFSSSASMPVPEMH